MTAQSLQLEVCTSAIAIEVDQVTLTAELSLPAAPKGMVLLSWSGRDHNGSSGIPILAPLLTEVGYATLAVGLLSPDEEQVDDQTGHLRFNPILLGRRLVGITDWVAAWPDAARLPIGYFAVATAATGALLAAVERPEQVCALVSWAGRPDLVAARLAAVTVPTLLVAENNDPALCRLNRLAASLLGGERRLAIVSTASSTPHRDSLSIEITGLVLDWLTRFLGKERPG